MAKGPVAQDLNLPQSDIEILAEDLAYADGAAPGLGQECLHYVLTGQEGR